ncbi:MAG: helix-turn-helix domain-containing protein [Spirochaetes bacterium]|nr:helix-turn-helix domain-containing protein [Spirochaetota bacterium]
MGNVVIVDDDRLVLYGVISYLHSGSSLHTVSGSFTDPEKAVRFILDHPCDVLITDIKMPKMSGFEVIERVKAVHPEIRVIVLSGHADFALARDAITLKVDAYLLKHEIDEHLLLATLDHLVADHAASGKKGYGESVRAMGQFIAFSQGKKEEHFIAVFSFKHRYDEAGREDAASPDLLMLYQMIADRLAQLGCGECFLGTHQDIVIVHRAEDACAVEHQTKILQHLREILGTVSRYLNFQAHIALAGRAYAAAELEAGYSEASENFGHGFFLRESSLILPGMRGARDIAEYAIPRLAFHESNPLESWEERIGEFFAVPFREIKDGAMRMKLHIAVALDTINSWLLRSYSLSFDQVLGETAGSLYERIYRVDDEETLKGMLLGLAVETRRQIERHKHSRTVIGAVKDYIDRNYARSLSLNEIADIFKINMSYLSTLFKQETGTNFIDYIHLLRLKQACALFLDQALSLKEIAFAVGYRDANHFSKVFSRMMGETATAHRERLLKAAEGSGDPR